MAIGNGLRTASAGLLAALLASVPDNAHPFLAPAGTRAGVAGGSGSGSGSGGGGATEADPSTQAIFAITGGGGGGGGGRGGMAAGGVVSAFAEGALDGRRRKLRWEQVAPRPAWVERRRSAATVAFLTSSAATGVDGGSVRGGSRVEKASGEAGKEKGEQEGRREQGKAGKAEDSVLSAGELLVEARRVYNDNFGPPEDDLNVCAGYAPGRVNLIGEHTDYNGGFVMPLALERGTVIYGVGRLVDSNDGAEGGAGAGWCRVLSENMLTETEAEGAVGEVRFRADEALSPGKPGWANYVKGVVKEFMAWVPEGKRLEFTAAVVGVVPIGGGVSSSASLSVAMGTFLEGVLSNAGVTPPSPKEKAHLCRMAEHNFLDMPCGIMDQFVTSMAVPGHAMLLDCRSEEPEAVPLSDSNLVIVVTNSNVKHKLAGSQYPVRVAQCAAARDEVKKSHPEVELLRDATPEQVEEIKATVEEAVFLRARHVVSENARTVEAARALKAGDYQTVGRLMLDSHRSLSKDYEVSCLELDTLVELAMEVEGVFGSRMTGGGFGGCTVTLANKDSVDDLVRHLHEGYARSSSGRDCSCFVTKPGFGARGLTGVDAATSLAWPE